MSSQIPKKNPQRKKSPTSSTNKASPKAEEPSVETLAALVGRMEGMLAPALDFHNSADEQEDDDIRFFYDVRIVRGKDKLFGRVTGSSTMIGLLADSQLHLSAEKVDTEMMSKIVTPVSIKFQELINRQALALRKDDDSFEPSAFPSGLPLGQSDDDLAMEAEIISQQEADKA